MAKSRQITEQSSFRARFCRLLLVCSIYLFVAACASTTTQELPVDTLLDKMTSEAMFELTPQETPHYFSELCQLHSKGAGEDLWIFDNSIPGRGMRWLRVEFQPGAEGKAEWALLQGSVALPLKTSRYPDVYGTLKTRLGEEFNKPEFEDEQPDGKIIAWSLGNYRQVVLRQGEVDNPYLDTREHVVLLEAVIIQGDE